MESYAQTSGKSKTEWVSLGDALALALETLAKTVAEREGKQ
jgi:hypothetical protein